MTYDAGTAALTVVPSFRNVEAAMRRQLRKIEQQLDKASQGVRIGVDVDSDNALARLRAVGTAASEIDRLRPKVRVSVDGDALDRLGASAGRSTQRLQMLVAAAATVGPAVIPVAAAASSAVGFIGEAAVSSAAGAGVLALGFSGVTDAVKALDAAHDAATKSSNALLDSHAAIANATDSLRGAESALASVREANADAARRSAQAVEDAERSLTRAQQEARQATLDLARAREEERRANQDLAFDVEGNAIAQRKANLDLAQAKRELDRVLADPKATKEQREQAKITYDEVSLRVRELAVQQRRLTDEQRAAAKAGVDGSRRVQAAQQRVRDTTDGVADAQRRLAEAVAAQQAQQRQGARALASAQRSVAAAQRSLDQALRQSAAAGGESITKLQQAMDNLSPAGQRFARFLFGLRDEVQTLRASAAEPLLPGVQRAIENLLPSLPALNRYVSEVAGSLGDMAEGASEFLTTDATWRRFWDYTGDTTVPTLERLGRMAGNTATGLAGLYLAFTPFNDDIGGGLEGLTERFSRWATTLERNPSFERFLAYVEENGPKVVDLIGEIAEFTIRYIDAAAPVGTVVVEAFTAVFEALNAIPMPVLTALATTITAISAAMLVARGAAIVWAAATAVQAGAQRIATQALQAYHAEMATATVRTGNFGGALTTTTAAMGAMGRSARGLVGFLGGPWGAALAAATLAAGYFISKQAEQKAKVDTLVVALTALSDEYRTLASTGRSAGAEAEAAFRNIVKNNPEMQKAVIELDRLGIGFDEMIKAATSGDPSAVVAALNKEMEKNERQLSTFLTDPKKTRAMAQRYDELKVIRDAFVENAEAIGQTRQATELLTAADERSNAVNAIKKRFADASADTQQRLVGIYDQNAARIQSLNGLVTAFGEAEATAAQKADVLRAAIEQQTGAAVAAIEQEEAWSQALLTLSGSVASNGASLALHTQAGLRNRDALQAAAQATREMYLEDIAAGKPIADVTKAHEGRIAALKEEARRLGLDRTETEKLIAAYGQVPDNIQTVIETKNFNKVFDELEKLHFAQFALKMGLSPKEAEKQWEREKKGTQYRGFKEGGFVRGPGTSTSDDIPAWLSDHEFVEPAHAVDHYGVGLFEALRHKAIPKWALPGYADGGLVMRAPYRVELSKTYVPTLDEVLSKIVPQPSAGGIGSDDMMKILRRPFPGLDLYSGWRPGSRTASGNLSYHARIAADGDKGRAVDIPPRQDVFTYIHDHFKRLTRELIWLGDAGRNIHNGQYHRYSQTLLNQHGVAGMPNAHIHWAMDSGGMLQPGWNPPIWNGTGAPEPVLTGVQWAQITRLARRGGNTPTTNHNLYFRDTTLTPGLWRQMQDTEKARAALNRDGRNR